MFITGSYRLVLCITGSYKEIITAIHLNAFKMSSVRCRHSFISQRRMKSPECRSVGISRYRSYFLCFPMKSFRKRNGPRVERRIPYPEVAGSNPVEVEILSRSSRSSMFSEYWYWAYEVWWIHFERTCSTIDVKYVSVILNHFCSIQNGFEMLYQLKMTLQHAIITCFTSTCCPNVHFLCAASTYVCL